MKFVLLLVLIALQNVNSQATNVVIRADTCNWWQKSGTWANEEGVIVTQWAQRCESLSPSDVIFTDANTTKQIGRTDEKLLSVTTTIRIRDENDNIVATLEEELIPHIFSSDVYTHYKLYVGDGNSNEIAESTEQRLWDASITWTCTGLSDQATCVTASQSGTNSVASAFCVDDAYWAVSITQNGNQTIPDWWFLAAMTIKAARDVDRDSDGRVSASLCQKAHATLMIILLCVLLPLGVFLVVFLVGWFGFGRFASVARCLRCPPGCRS